MRASIESGNAGAAAMYLEAHRDAFPDEVHAAILGHGTEGVLRGWGSDWPNLLPYTKGIGDAPGSTIP